MPLVIDVRSGKQDILGEMSGVGWVRFHRMWYMCPKSVRLGLQFEKCLFFASISLFIYLFLVSFSSVKYLEVEWLLSDRRSVIASLLL